MNTAIPPSISQTSLRKARTPALAWLDRMRRLGRRPLCQMVSDRRDRTADCRAMEPSGPTLCIRAPVPSRTLRIRHQDFTQLGRRVTGLLTTLTAQLAAGVSGHQRSRRGPSSAPATVHRMMVPPYQSAMNGRESSMQCSA